jgi:hypothetical protein
MLLKVSVVVEINENLDVLSVISLYFGFQN